MSASVIGLPVVLTTAHLLLAAPGQPAQLPTSAKRGEHGDTAAGQGRSVAQPGATPRTPGGRKRRYLELRIGLTGLAGKSEYGSGPLLSFDGRFHLTSAAPDSGAGLSAYGGIDIDLAGTTSPPCTRCPDPDGATRRFYLLRGGFSYGWLVRQHQIVASAGFEMLKVPGAEPTKSGIGSLFLSVGATATLKLLPKIFIGLSVDIFPAGVNDNHTWGHERGVAGGLEIVSRLGRFLVGVRYRILYFEAVGTYAFSGVPETLHLAGAYGGFTYR